MTIQAEKVSCAPEERTAIKDTTGAVLLETCQKELGLCAYDGTCLFRSAHGDRLFNAVDSNLRTGEATFVELNLKRCRYGLGQRNICLDPFYSVAADLKEFRLGDVLFIPALKGLALPGGSTHSGYVIVRDSSPIFRGTGPHRLHFFTGDIRDTETKNPFVKVGLDRPEREFTYERISGEKAEVVRKARNFPRLPGVSPSEAVNR